MNADRIPSPQRPTSDPLPPPPTYYRQHGITVTGRHFSDGAYRYEIAELVDVVHTRGSIHPGVIVGMVIAVAEAALAIPLVGLLKTPLAWFLAIVALLIPCLVGLVCAHRWPPQYELLALYRGRRVTLLATRSEREFGQVSRAVMRAMEALPRRS